MKSRTLDNLILENEDSIFEGDITIAGNVDIKNGDIIVLGNLTIFDEVNIENGSIIVSGILEISHDADIIITGGDISCGALNCNNINITDGDIWVNDTLHAFNITSDGNVEVGRNVFTRDITCFNCFVNGDNNSFNIRAFQDIYILGDNLSQKLTAREIFVGGYFNAHIHSITAYHFECAEKLSFDEIFLD